MKWMDADKNYLENLFPCRELYKNLFENAGEAIFFLKEAQIIDCNKTAVKALKFDSKDKIIGKDFSFFSPDFQTDGTNSEEKIGKLLSSSANSADSFSFYWKFKRNDGTTFEAKLTLNTFVIDNNQTLLQLSFHPDLTSEQLIFSERKYQKIFENVQDVFYQTDINGIIIDISPSVKKYSPYSAQEIIGHHIDEFYYNPEDRKLIIQKIEERGEILDYEVRLKGFGNQVYYASLNAHFIFDSAGNVTGIEGSLRDLAERKQAAEKLKLMVSQLQATLDSTSDGILVVNSSGQITSYNRQFKQMFNHLDETLESGEDKAAINSVLNQLKDPDQFVSKIQYLYEHPELESLDTIELKDGRILERYSCPQRLDGKPIGRVWNFRDITKRKQDEQQLLLMAHTLKSVNESVTITDTNNRILFINEAFRKTYGYCEDELIGQDISVIRSSNNDPVVIDKIFNITFETGWQGEIMNRRKDGTDFPISLSTTIVKNDMGEVLGLVGVGSDITERKRVEKELKESEERYRLLIESQGEGLGVVDPNENFTFVNPAAEAIFGVEPGKLLGRNLKEFMTPEYFEQILQESGKRSKKERSTYEVDVLSQDGKHKNLLITATPQTNDEGEYIGTFGVFRDITDRKQAEERLRQSEMKYRNLIETMPDGVYRSTPEGKFVEVNQAMVEILGYDSKEELMAIDIKTQLYFNPEDRDLLVLQYDDKNMDVYPLKKKDGTTVWVEDHGWYIKDENDQILFHEGISRDVTDRRMDEIQVQKYSEELEELNATKDKLFSIIAHDLKSPFNSIIGLSELIKNEAKYMDVATIEQFAGVINTTSNNTYRLLENLLDWARVQQSRMPFNPGAILLNKVVGEVIELMLERANSKMIAIINYIPDNLIVFADENMLKTVLRNLISNAIKFTPINGNVKINAVQMPHEILISVKDTGTGIKADDINKLFRIDSNFTKRGTENEKGTGLGLLLCKEFVEKHGGKILVESEEGKGSIFSFSISQIESNPLLT